jgi:hypothetical protein
MVKQHDDDGKQLALESERVKRQDGDKPLTEGLRRQATESTYSISDQSVSTVGGVDEITPKNELGQYDIICGRSKLAFNNVGNRRFRVTVSLSLDRYMSAATRKETSNVIKSVAEIVRGNGGRFLKPRPDGTWVDLEEKHVHEKVGHALRDAAALRKETDGSRRYDYISEVNVALEPRQKSSSVLGRAFASTFSGRSISFTEHDWSMANLPDTSEQGDHDQKQPSKKRKGYRGKLDWFVGTAASLSTQRSQLSLPSFMEPKTLDRSKAHRSHTERDHYLSENSASLDHDALDWMSDDSDFSFDLFNNQQSQKERNRYHSEDNSCICVIM